MSSVNKGIECYDKKEIINQKHDLNISDRCDRKLLLSDISSDDLIKIEKKFLVLYKDYNSSIDCGVLKNSIQAASVQKSLNNNINNSELQDSNNPKTQEPDPVLNLSNVGSGPTINSHGKLSDGNEDFKSQNFLSPLNLDFSHKYKCLLDQIMNENLCPVNNDSLESQIVSILIGSNESKSLKKKKTNPVIKSAKNTSSKVIEESFLKKEKSFKTSDKKLYEGSPLKKSSIVNVEGGCQHCGTGQTPQWRYIHREKFCNACYMRIKRWVQCNMGGRKLPCRAKSDLTPSEDTQYSMVADVIIKLALLSTKTE